MNAPTMTPGTVEMVNVEWIMQNVDKSIDGFEMYDDDYNETVDYHAMIMDKTRDRDFPDLVKTIVTRGFQVPIVLVKNYGSSNLMHGNGHHRMCAAILLCLDEIPVYWTDYDEEADYMCEHTSEGETLLSDTKGEYTYDFYTEFISE